MGLIVLMSSLLFVFWSWCEFTLRFVCWILETPIPYIKGEQVGEGLVPEQFFFTVLWPKVAINDDLERENEEVNGVGMQDLKPTHLQYRLGQALSMFCSLSL